MVLWLRLGRNTWKRQPLLVSRLSSDPRRHLQINIGQSLTDINQLLEWFRQLASKYKNGLPEIIFSFPPGPLPTAMPPVSRNLNSAFLVQKDTVSKIVDALDVIPSHGADLVREKRKSAIEEAVGYLESLERFIVQSWDDLRDAAFQGYTLTSISTTPTDVLYFNVGPNELIDETLEEHRRHSQRFVAMGIPSIRFESKYPTPLPHKPPSLPITLNERYLLHRDSTERIIQRLGDIQATDHQSAAKLELAVKELSEYMQYLDRLVEDSWSMYKRQSDRFASSQATDKASMTVDMGKFFYVSSFASTEIIPLSRIF